MLAGMLIFIQNKLLQINFIEIFILNVYLNAVIYLYILRIFFKKLFYRAPVNVFFCRSNAEKFSKGKIQN